MSLETPLAHLKIEHPVMNGAGTTKYLEGDPLSVRTLASSALAAIMMGSITVARRDGNPGNVFHPGDAYSLNSLGLPTPGGIDNYRTTIPKMAEACHVAGKPLIVSVAGFTPTEYADLALMALTAGAELVELNLGCPNVWDGGAQKRIACFDPKLVSRILIEVAEATNHAPHIMVKLSPFSDPSALTEVAAVIAASSIVRVVTSMNTFPNALLLDNTGQPLIDVPDGLAGLSGPAILPIGLGQVRQLRKALPDHIQIVGVGGITRGQDVLDYIRAGATAVQVTTGLFQRGPAFVSQILTEYTDLVAT